MITTQHAAAEIQSLSRPLAQPRPCERYQGSAMTVTGDLVGVGGRVFVSAAGVVGVGGPCTDLLVRLSACAKITSRNRRNSLPVKALRSMLRSYFVTSGRIRRMDEPRACDGDERWLDGRARCAPYHANNANNPNKESRAPGPLPSRAKPSRSMMRASLYVGWICFPSLCLGGAGSPGKHTRVQSFPSPLSLSQFTWRRREQVRAPPTVRWGRQHQRQHAAGSCLRRGRGRAVAPTGELAILHE